ncbi:hypothetical protein GCM10027586_08410 [Kineococcus gypseus]|uniref:hypothetical protein n=1 Tax=Kineococcus gypseus TaxID=1637102 RepID=UPI003D7F0966
MSSEAHIVEDAGVPVAVLLHGRHLVVHHAHRWHERPAIPWWRSLRRLPTTGSGHGHRGAQTSAAASQAGVTVAGASTVREAPSDLVDLVDLVDVERWQLQARACVDAACRCCRTAAGEQAAPTRTDDSADEIDAFDGIDKIDAFDAFDAPTYEHSSAAAVLLDAVRRSTGWQVLHMDLVSAEAAAGAHGGEHLDEVLTDLPEDSVPEPTELLTHVPGERSAQHCPDRASGGGSLSSTDTSMRLEHVSGVFPGQVVSSAHGRGGSSTG